MREIIPLHGRGRNAEPACNFCQAPQSPELIRLSPQGRVIASFGAFIPGWSLVVPSQHVPSTASLTRREWGEFEGLLMETRALIEANLGPTVAFEHGAADFTRASGCGVDHAHIHLVPGDFHLRREVSSLGSEFARYEWVSSASNRPSAAPGDDYIWIQDRTGTWICRTRDQPSQVVRRALAQTLGIKTWDWKLDHRLDTVALTQRLLGAPAHEKV